MGADPRQHGRDQQVRQIAQRVADLVEVERALEIERQDPQQPLVLEFAQGAEHLVLAASQRIIERGPRRARERGKTVAGRRLELPQQRRVLDEQAPDARTGRDDGGGALQRQVPARAGPRRSAGGAPSASVRRCRRRSAISRKARCGSGQATAASIAWAANRSVSRPSGPASCVAWRSLRIAARYESAAAGSRKPRRASSASLSSRGGRRSARAEMLMGASHRRNDSLT
jgi:hypothetical protein